MIEPRTCSRYLQHRERMHKKFELVTSTEEAAALRKSYVQPFRKIREKARKNPLLEVVDAKVRTVIFLAKDALDCEADWNEVEAIFDRKPYCTIRPWRSNN